MKAAENSMTQPIDGAIDSALAIARPTGAISAASSARSIDVEAYLPLVTLIAKKLIRQLAKASIDLDDLISAGTIGLIDAATRYDRARIASFKAYAEIRVRGAMIDWLRSMDWLPRSVRASVRREESNAGVVAIEDLGEAAYGNDASAQAVAEHNETKVRLVAAIASLPARDREVLSLYYVEELTFKEIGAIYSFSEARACQIHTMCVARLRAQVTKGAT